MLTTLTSNKIPPPLPSPPPSTNLKIPHTLFKSIDRRQIILTSLALSITPFFTSPELNDSQARGLFQMPPLRLSNRYFLVRAGESEFESFGIINTNPVAKTSMDSGLSVEGRKQTVRAALQLKAMGACEDNCWIWPSITQRAYQAAEIIAAVNGVTRRYTFQYSAEIVDAVG
ncbi:hypothetical protein RJ640_010845, partial [Escallonia rubra]